MSRRPSPRVAGSGAEGARSSMLAPHPEPEPEAEPPEHDARAEARAARAAAAAAQAGTDTWKTWARRREGSDGFQFSDLLWGTTAQISHRWRRRRGDERREGKACPICDETSPPPDAEGKRWLRLFCGCTVCSTCVRGWTMSLLEQSGGAASVGAVKLTCPSCSAPLRTSDAKEALTRCPSVATKYDTLSRDATLRAMPEWRNCPRCDGGGFSTPECLAPRHSAAFESGHGIAVHHLAACGWLWLGCLLLVWCFPASYLPERPPGDQLHVGLGLLVVGLSASQLRRRAERLVAEELRAPLSVGCPECQHEFLLAVRRPRLPSLYVRFWS